MKHKNYRYAQVYVSHLFQTYAFIIKELQVYKLQQFFKFAQYEFVCKFTSPTYHMPLSDLWFIDNNNKIKTQCRVCYNSLLLYVWTDYNSHTASHNSSRWTVKYHTDKHTHTHKHTHHVAAVDNAVTHWSNDIQL